MGGMICIRRRARETSDANSRADEYIRNFNGLYYPRRTVVQDTIDAEKLDFMRSLLLSKKKRKHATAEEYE